jgi:hypothetical protein
VIVTLLGISIVASIIAQRRDPKHHELPTAEAAPPEERQR